MSFNELNSVENYIIKQLTGVNLNTNEVSENNTLYSDFWKYTQYLSNGKFILSSELE